MVYDYNLTYADYLAAQRVYRNQKWTRRVWFVFWIWVLPLLGLAVVLFELFMYARYGQLDLPAIFMGLWFALGIPLARMYQLRKCWKLLNPTADKEISVDLEWNDEQVISRVKGRSEGRFFWSTICGMTGDSEITLLFIQKKRFLFIPNRVLPQEAWDDLRAHYATSGSKQC